MHNTPLADYRLVVEPAAKAAAEAPKGSDPMAMAHQQQLDAIRAMQEQASQAAEQASHLPLCAVDPVVIRLGIAWIQLKALQSSYALIGERGLYKFDIVLCGHLGSGSLQPCGQVFKKAVGCYVAVGVRAFRKHFTCSHCHPVCPVDWLVEDCCTSKALSRVPSC